MTEFLDAEQHMQDEMQHQEKEPDAVHGKTTKGRRVIVVEEVASDDLEVDEKLAPAAAARHQAGRRQAAIDAGMVINEEVRPRGVFSACLMPILIPRSQQGGGEKAGEVDSWSEDEDAYEVTDLEAGTQDGMNGTEWCQRLVEATGMRIAHDPETLERWRQNADLPWYEEENALAENTDGFVDGNAQAAEQAEAEQIAAETQAEIERRWKSEQEDGGAPVFLNEFIRCTLTRSAHPLCRWNGCRVHGALACAE